MTECALAELAKAVPESELRSAIAEIRRSGTAPPAVAEAAADAGAICGP